MAKSVSTESSVDKVLFGAVFVLLSIGTLIVSFGLFLEPTSTVLDRILGLFFGGALTYSLVEIWKIRPRG